ncbi:MAG TPA: hypothetical protein O0X97_05195 [Methanocorpusculum sp.]|nr:hypothetical protein [Methanocorpusculum sp.]
MNQEKIEAASSMLDRIQSTIDWKHEVDEKYGTTPGEDEEKVFPLPVPSADTDDKEFYAKLLAILRIQAMYQRNSLRRFNMVIRDTVRDPAAQDALLERFGGNKSLKEIYMDGCTEISDIGKEFKRLFKEVKQMKKAK